MESMADHETPLMKRNGSAKESTTVILVPVIRKCVIFTHVKILEYLDITLLGDEAPGVSSVIFPILETHVLCYVMCYVAGYLDSDGPVVEGTYR